jgi:hypothetical protein
VVAVHMSESNREAAVWRGEARVGIRVGRTNLRDNLPAVGDLKVRLAARLPHGRATCVCVKARIVQSLI